MTNRPGCKEDFSNSVEGSAKLELPDAASVTASSTPGANLFQILDESDTSVTMEGAPGLLAVALNRVMLCPVCAEDEYAIAAEVWVKPRAAVLDARNTVGGIERRLSGTHTSTEHRAPSGAS